MHHRDDADDGRCSSPSDPESSCRTWEMEEERRSATSQRDLRTLQDIEELERSGQYLQTIRAYREANAPAQAARLARKLGRHEQAARCYVEAGMPYQAAACFIKARRVEESLEQLVRVPADSANYRKACVHAVKLCHRAGVMTRSTFKFLDPFITQIPVDERERRAMFLLGDILESKSLSSSARQVYRMMLASPPDRHMAEVRLEALDVGRAPGPESSVSVEPSEAQAGRAQVRERRAPSPPQGDGWVGVGEVLAERYEVVSLLGAGGMAAVYQATDMELDETVALKLFRPLSGDQQLIQRFKRELAVTRRLTHAHIVRVHDIGSCKHGPFMTMELLEGDPLSVLIERDPIDIPRGVRMLAQACDGLAAVHAVGVVHRDIKPENLFVTSEGIVKVMDFGIAKQQCQPTLTTAGFLAGSPAYMAPEQITDFRAATHAADVYALGVVAYELFTKRLPFEADEVVPLLMKHCTAPVPPPRQFNPTMPDALERLILAALEKNPKQRVASSADFRDSLLAIGEALGRAR